MPSIDLVVESKIERTPRVMQLEGMFDVPPTEQSKLEWHGDLPIEDGAWHVGLIVGPSGSGKTLIARQLFAEHYHVPLSWQKGAVVDDFDSVFSMEDISKVCQAVGFNTIPAWMRPHKVLSNGEQFRADLARRLLECDSPIVVDEFSSVIDRQVAKIASHAVQKYVRKHDQQFVAVSCHYDIIEWLQPDWIFEPATMKFTRRSLRRRPKVEVVIAPVSYEFWKIFAPYHYLTRSLNKSARCFALWADGQLASFQATLYRPHPRSRNIIGGSRSVTLPDWQGLGLAMVHADQVGAAYKACGFRFIVPPAHPSFIRAFDQSPNWALRKRPGRYVQSSRVHSRTKAKDSNKGRACATFEYCGPALDDHELALALVGKEFRG